MNGRTMIPCTEILMNQMMALVVETMQAHGLVGIDQDEEAIAAETMQVLAAQGLVRDDGKVPLGRCVALPSQGPGLALLFATPWPADEFDADLHRKSSPIQFERTSTGQIVVQGRRILAKLEELTENPVAPEGLQTHALTITRTALPIPDISLPPETETIALKINNQDGTETIWEALPAGIVLLCEKGG